MGKIVSRNGTLATELPHLGKIPSFFINNNLYIIIYEIRLHTAPNTLNRSANEKVRKWVIN